MFNKQNLCWPLLFDIITYSSCSMYNQMHVTNKILQAKRQNWYGYRNTSQWVRLFIPGQSLCVPTCLKGSHYVQHFANLHHKDDCLKSGTYKWRHAVSFSYFSSHLEFWQCCNVEHASNSALYTFILQRKLIDLKSVCNGSVKRKTKNEYGRRRCWFQNIKWFIY